MPRNLTGGNRAKAGKNVVASKAELHEIDESQGQMAGRVVKGLGDRNMLLYCNDGKERIAHIRGGLRKKVARIEVGDIVLLSLRGEAMGATQGSVLDKGDILAKFEREVYRELKKVAGINPKLFNQVESSAAADDCGFDMDGGDDEEDEDGSVELTKEEREIKKTKEEAKRSMLREAKASAREVCDDTIDIDAI
jgi:translation initiation factor 1A